MKENQSSYRQIIKATSLFGGVQVFNIIISIIKSKIIAVLLGPSGMGIAGLLTSTIGLVGTITNFGLRTSAVKDIAAANESQDSNRVSKIATIFRRLVWITGVLGAIVTIIFSPWLSEFAFDNRDYSIAFIWLSITLLFNQLTSGQNVLLQGMRKLKDLAKANMIGSSLGLLVTTPLYYFYDIDGIVPAIILSSILSLLIAYFFANKIKIKKIKVTIQDTLQEGNEMLKMGFILSISGLITQAAAYGVRIFVSNTGSIEDVGLYNAGFAIIGTYVGLVFAAMATDYYPRLSGVADNNYKANKLINQQAEICVLILAPILSVFLIFINWIIIILYSTKFIPINDMIHWAALGMYFKSVSWAIGFILFAKGASKTFFWSELIASFYLFLFNIIGYKYFGLKGLGISFLIGYIIVLFQIYYIAKYKYSFSFNTEFYKIFGIQFLLGLLSFMVIKYLPTPLAYYVGIPFIFISTYFSYKELDKRIGIKQLLTKYLKR
ncbi:O-antigen translocase [Gaetbulibacter sp. 4G1]|nr:oligosaccharide flippase family protein [Gaetbulibacter sp. 4G1]PIA77543.1 O-antigen translocase [Gaetbulibacter sp. 4G1]